MAEDKRYGPWREIEIDGIPCLARRDNDTVSYARWNIVEKTTGASLLPSSWPGDMSAATLKGAINIVRKETIDRHGKPAIERRIKELQAEQQSQRISPPSSAQKPGWAYRARRGEVSSRAGTVRK